jgi:Tol biopolymer transport system component
LKKRLQAIGDARIEIEDSLPVSDSAGALAVADDAEHRLPRRWFGPITGIGAGLFLTVVVGLVVFLARGRTAKTPTWTADIVPGPNVAFGPRISPDGHTLAFQAMIGDLTQVAVASPDNGNWTLLTHDRQHGFVDSISWAPDGSKLYYDRVTALPTGVYSVPALGGEERLVLENAGSPETLPDGSLLVVHSDSDGRWRINHYWPDSQRLEPMPGWIPIDTTMPLRAFPNGKEAAFYGLASATDLTPQLYALNVATGKTRRLLTTGPRLKYNEGYPIATTSDGASVLVDSPQGELHRIIAVPRSGSGRVQTVLTLTSPPWYIDAAKDGTLYVDLMDRPHEILSYPTSGGVPEVMAHADTVVMAGRYMEPVRASGGGLLLESRFSGGRRMLIGKPGGDFLPLLDSSEESAAPATSLGGDEVALVVGSGNDAQVVIVSVAEGRVIRWLQGSKGKHIDSLASSPDSKTLYFGAEGAIWSIPVSDGVPLKITNGDCLAVNPNGRELVVMVNQTSSPFLTRVFPAGGEAKKIPVESGFSLAAVPLGSHGIDKNGKLLVTVSPADSWFYRVAILDPGTGRITPVNVTYSGDTLTANWGEDGRILAVGLPLKGHIWRFRRTAE